MVEVARVEPRSPRMVRITLTGPALDGFDPGLPAASVRVLLPADATEVVLPTWTGNEFLLEDGSRPIIRTLTPLRFEPGPLELDVEIVRHGHGPLSAWADAAKPGDRAAVSSTRTCTFASDGGEGRFVAGCPPIPSPPWHWYRLETGSRPGDSLAVAVTGARLDPDVRVWAAGEAAALQRIRRHLFDERGLPRSRAVVRGYWKHGRGDSEAD